jgi:hypothetical protein
VVTVAVVSGELGAEENRGSEGESKPEWEREEA